MGDRTGVREQRGDKKLRVATHSPPPPISKNGGGLGGLLFQNSLLGQKHRRLGARGTRGSRGTRGTRGTRRD